MTLLPTQLFSQVEICDNRIDDDGDGLIDCLDPDCSGTETCWDCISEFYQVHSNEFLVSLDPSTGTYNTMGTITGADQINGVQFNQIDGHVYAPVIKNGEHKLGMLLQTGEVRETGLNLPGNNIFYVGSIDAAGTMYVSNSGGIYSIELNSPTLQAVSTGLSNPGVADFAYDIIRGLFYGINNGQLKVFNPRTLDVITYSLAGSINNDPGAFGAAWSCNDGSFFAYNNSSGKIYAVDVVTLTATQVLNGTGNLSINDGFNCVLAPPPFESICNNGIDDDGDGVVDCADGDCFTSNECTIEICDNGIDDDGDGWIDCSDTECFNLSFCVEICDNGIDDNGDGLIDDEDPQCNTPAGVTGGLESNGSLADKISKRNIRNTLQKDELTKMKKAGIIPFTTTMDKRAFDISHFIPEEAFDAFVAESTPEDLIGITNAKDVVAADYYIQNQRVASILAIESNNVYEHTKYICDRLAGSRLIDISQMFQNGGLFMTYELLNRQSKVEYVVSFSMHYDESEGFTIENHWNLHSYPEGKNYYNFQIWASDYVQLSTLLQETLNNVTDTGDIKIINNSNLPSVFVTHGQYKNGNLRLQIRNKIGAEELKFRAMVRRSETGDLEVLDIDLKLNGSQSEIINVPVGYIYDLGSSLTTVGSTSDEIFVADGRWTVDTEHQGASVLKHEIFPQEDNFIEDGYQVERSIELHADVKDYLNIYRSLDPKYYPISLDEYNMLSFAAEGTGLMEITLVKESIDEWEQQPRTQIRLQGEKKTYNLNREIFNEENEKPWNDIVMIVFSLINDQGDTQTYEIEISDMVFQNLITSSSNEIVASTDGSLITPNPVDDIAQIIFDSNVSSESNTRVHNTLGHIVIQKRVKTTIGENKVNLELGVLPSGYYTYTIEQNKLIHKKGKFIKH